jgi:hypothetical protein
MPFLVPAIAVDWDIPRDRLIAEGMDGRRRDRRILFPQITKISSFRQRGVSSFPAIASLQISAVGAAQGPGSCLGYGESNEVKMAVSRMAGREICCANLACAAISPAILSAMTGFYAGPVQV